MNQPHLKHTVVTISEPGTNIITIYHDIIEWIDQITKSSKHSNYFKVIFYLRGREEHRGTPIKGNSLGLVSFAGLRPRDCLGNDSPHVLMALIRREAKLRSRTPSSETTRIGVS